jgi:hypothetical protein
MRAEVIERISMFLIEAVGRGAKAKRSRLAQPKLAVILPLPQFLAIF